MLNQSPMTVQFTTDTVSRINEIALHQNRSGNEIIEEAVNSYLDYMSRFRSEVRKGLEDSKAGRVISHADLKESLRGLGVDLD